MFGYTKKELIGHAWIELTHPEDRSLNVEKFQQALGGKIEHYELDQRFIRKDGSIVHVALSVVCQRSDDGSAHHFLASYLDITDRIKMEHRIREDLQEKRTLLQEIHHRVKNNMQIIVSLLNLQSAQIADPQVQAKFKESQKRIFSMALVHDMLYGSENFSRIDFGRYLQRLIEYVWQSYQPDLPATALELDAESLEISIDDAVPCGLIVQELLSNALKYAFPKGWKGEPKIRIGLRRISGKIELTVRDNGVGIPLDVDIGTTKSLGLTLVDILGNHQLNGKISLDRTGGTLFAMRFERKGLRQYTFQEYM